jgi:Cu(I)/Ag(I) efflux system membrane fusion protein/cobalt-zinc-cadmium efflux system membrane fusion protein
MDEHALLIPDPAVIDTGERQVVFVSLGKGRFEPRIVQTGLANADGTVQVLKGLAAGETVVTSGQFLLDTESRMQEAIQKYLSQNGAAADGAKPMPPGHQH